MYARQSLFDSISASSCAVSFFEGGPASHERTDPAWISRVSAPCHARGSAGRPAKRASAQSASFGDTLHRSYHRTSTPARAAILTGLKPWNHGMLGFGNVAPEYEFEMPATLTAIGYSTTVIGKDHFGWNASAAPTMDLEDHGSGVKHGYEKLSIYDGADEPVKRGPDDYDQWCKMVMLFLFAALPSR